MLWDDERAGGRWLEGSVINSPKISTGLYDFQAFSGGKSFLADKILLSGIKSQVGDAVIAYFDR